MKLQLLPAVLPVTFLPLDEFEALRHEDFPSEEHELPYKVPVINPNGCPVVIGYGIRDDIPCRIEPIAGTPEGRVLQMKQTGRKCDTCENFPPDHEMIVEHDFETTLLGYICNECFDGVLQMKKKKGVAEAQQEAASIKNKMRAIKKAERSRRRAGRRGRK